MAALAKARARRQETWKHKVFVLIAGTKAFKGGACVLRTDGKVQPATSSLGNKSLGVFDDEVDAAAGDKNVAVDLIDELRLEWYSNDVGGGAVLATDVGKVVYFLDDQTVTITPTGRSIAGIVWSVDTLNGVAVQKLAFASLQSGDRVAVYLKVADDAGASTATAESLFYRAPKKSTVLAVHYGPSAALTADNANNATLTLRKRDGAGGAALSVAAATTNVAGTGSWSAFQGVSLGTVSNTALEAGNVLTFEISKAGTGVVVPRGTLVVQIVEV